MRHEKVSFMNKTITTVIAVLMFIGACIAGFWQIDKRYAHAEDVKNQQKAIILINERLELFILKDKIDILNKEIAAIVDRCKTDDPLKMPVGDRESYRAKKEQLRILNEQLKAMLAK